MSEFRADLHCHSTCSDGTLTPAEIVRLAFSKGLSGLSITDHDTISAYAEAIPEAKKHNLPLITGVEFSAVQGETSIHLLAYSFPVNAPDITEFCQKHEKRRTDRNLGILEKLAKKGMVILPEELKITEHSHVIGRPHIAFALMKKGLVNSIQQAFQLYIGEGRSCYVPGDKVTVEETLDVIHRAKGLAIIAHPHLIDSPKVLKQLLELEFDGIEGYYGRFQPAQNERWVEIGLKRGWIITGGSDFHGEIKPNLPLGSSWVNEQTFTILQNHFENNTKMMDE